MFVGTHERQLDPKGRLALPAPYRQKFEDRIILALGRRGCVDAYTPTEFERMAAETLEKERNGEIDLDEARAVFSNAFEVEFDTQGRVNVSPPLREYAGLSLGSKVVVTGVWNHLELWDPQRFVEANQRGTSRRSAGA